MTAPKYGSAGRFDVEEYRGFRVGDVAISNGWRVRIVRLHYIPGGYVADVKRVNPDTFVNEWTASAESLTDARLAPGAP